jgi:ubiquinone/menaquinone biosynthesis C-methylase UbiE
MESVPDYKQVARQEWTDAAPYWEKWNDKLSTQSQAGTDLIVSRAQVAPGMQVLDLASGAGQPSFTLAALVGPQGRVVATDLVPGMLDSIRRRAAERGIAHMQCRLADAEQLPFADAEFDRVTCRFGLMFFPDVQKALREVRRVLKPGGRVSFLTWGSLEENPMFAISVVPFMKRANLPPPPPDAPTVFRFADPVHLASEFTQAGFQHASASSHQLPWPWPGSPEEALESMQEIAAPFRKMIATLSPAQLSEAVQEVLEGMRRFHDGSKINFQATVVSATALA